MGRKLRNIKNRARRRRKERCINLYLRVRSNRNKKRRKKFHHYSNSLHPNIYSQTENIAPSDFRLLKNTKKCCDFFHRVRKRAQKNQAVGINQIIIDFSHTSQIDFASIQVLNAIGEELMAGTPSCIMRGFLPQDKKCKQYLIDSGFLEGKVNEYGIQFQPSRSTSKMKITVGQSLWTDADGRNAVQIAEKTQRHLHGTKSPTFITITIKEICGNSVEWGNSKHKQWVLAAKFEKDCVEYIALDLGEGILKTIHRDFWQKIGELGFTNDSEILWNAFDKKYFSHSKDPNRHKGLPQIKWEYKQGHFKELYVLTNGVLLNFSDESKKLNMGKVGFQGTLYRWLITPDCMN